MGSELGKSELSGLVLKDLKTIRGRRIRPRADELPALREIAQRLTSPDVGNDGARIAATIQMAAQRLEPPIREALLMLLGFASGTGELDTSERRRRAASEIESTESSFRRNFEEGYLQGLATDLVELDAGSSSMSVVLPGVDSIENETGIEQSIKASEAASAEVPPGSEIGYVSTISPQPAVDPSTSWGRPVNRFKNLPRGKKLIAVGALAGVMIGLAGLLSWVGVSLTETSNNQGAFARPAAIAPSYCLSPPVLPKEGKGTIYVSLDQESVSSRSCWTPLLAPVRPGSILKYMVTYKNTSTNEQDRVAVKLNLATNLLLVSNSTWLYNEANPKGVRYRAEAIFSNGIRIGNYNPGGGAYITVKVAIPQTADFRCGTNDIHTGVEVTPQGGGSALGSAEFQVFRSC